MGFILKKNILNCLTEIAYAPLTKRNDGSFSCRKDEIEYMHSINQSAKWWESHSAIGIVSSIEIIAINNEKSVLSFN